MRRIVNQIRDLGLIEKELNSNITGVLALGIDEDKIAQIVTPYLYLDKNIYIFFRDENELFESIKFQSEVSFTIVKTEKAKKSPKADFTPIYHIFSIKISGLIKKLDDLKTIDDIRQNYLKKYSTGEEKSEETPVKINKVVLIDSREIQAIEEIGG